MTGAFRPEPEASAELEDAAVWYEGQRPGLGLEFVHAVDVALEQIVGWPQIGRRVTGLPDELPARQVPVKRSRTAWCTYRGKGHFEFWRLRTTAVNPATGSPASASSSLRQPNATHQARRAPAIANSTFASARRRLHAKLDITDSMPLISRNVAAASLEPAAHLRR
jgi:plasmid stabilization system protein ParE